MDSIKTDITDFITGGETRCTNSNGPSDFALAFFIIWFVMLLVVLLYSRKMNVSNKMKSQFFKDTLMSLVGCYIFYINLKKCRAIRGVLIGLVISSLGSLLLDAIFFSDISSMEKLSFMEQLQITMGIRKI